MPRSVHGIMPQQSPPVWQKSLLIPQPRAWRATERTSKKTSLLITAMGQCGALGLLLPAGGRCGIVPGRP
jgi:hypothetical protein